MNEDWIRAIEGVGRATAVRDIFGRGRRYSQRRYFVSGQGEAMSVWEICKHNGAIGLRVRLLMRAVLCWQVGVLTIADHFYVAHPCATIRPLV
jgi:hypothetical protein